MTLRVELHPLAEADLYGLYEYIDSRAGPRIAGGYLDRIEALCANLARLPDRGRPRDDLAPGVRTVSLERRVLVAYRSNKEAVLILRVFYAGRDFSTDDLPP